MENNKSNNSDGGSIFDILSGMGVAGGSPFATGHKHRNVESEAQKIISVYDGLSVIVKPNTPVLSGQEMTIIECIKPLIDLSIIKSFAFIFFIWRYS